MTTVTLKGNTVHLTGTFPTVGSTAKDFTLVDIHLQDKTLKSFPSVKKILLIVPSLETPTCVICTKEFHSRVVNRKDVALLVVSADLPFTQKNHAVAENQNLHLLSMMRDKSFAKDYGVLIQDGPLAGICTRAVLLLDENNKVIYAELVPEITSETNYDKLFALL